MGEVRHTTTGFITSVIAFPSRFVLVFLLGLALRVAGLPFNGMTDLYQMLLEWGAAVDRDGLAHAFGINYGILSYAAFGLAAAAADIAPRFWWAPYKVIILLFDLGVLLALLRLVPRERRTLVLVLFWINPWFVLHEAYHGFWEAPHILFGLLAVLAARHLHDGPQAAQTALRQGLVWATVGALLMGSAMFKPHGLVHFIGPLGLYLGVQAWHQRPRAAMPLTALLTGIMGVAVSTSAAIWAAGGSAIALVDNYRSAFATQLGVSNGGPGIWRFVAFVYMRLTGQTGHVAFVRMPRLMLASLSAVGAVACVSILVWFAVRVARQTAVEHAPNAERRTQNAGREQQQPANRLRQGYGGPPKLHAKADDPAYILLLVLALGSLVLSQFGVRAHINHTYPALVLLVPFAVERRDLLRPWVAMTSLVGVSHVLIYAFGNAALLPPAGILHRYPAASSLIDQVTRLPAYHTPDRVLRVQAWVSGVVEGLPGETIVSLLSPVVFVVACLMVRSIFSEAEDSRL